MTKRNKFNSKLDNQSTKQIFGIKETFDIPYSGEHWMQPVFTITLSADPTHTSKCEWKYQTICK